MNVTTFRYEVVVILPAGELNDDTNLEETLAATAIGLRETIEDEMWDLNWHIEVHGLSAVEAV